MLNVNDSEGRSYCDLSANIDLIFSDKLESISVDSIILLILYR
jgi:hypothetical protein